MALFLGMKLPLLLAGLCLSASLTHAQTITWGNTPGEVLVDSKDEALTATWKFELGVFLPGFYPTQENIAEWVSNWVVLDEAKLNEKIGYFASRAPAPQAEAAGLQAYIWVYNERKYNPASEWLLITDRDGNHSNDWMIPNRSDSPTAAVIDWRVSRATTVLMGNAPRLTAKKDEPAKEGEPKISRKVSHRTAQIPAAAIAAANAPKGPDEPAALAGELTEEFTTE